MKQKYSDKELDFFKNLEADFEQNENGLSYSEILYHIKAKVLELNSDAEVILYGSRVRGEAHSESDWDILILLPIVVDLQEEQRFRYHLLDVEMEYGQAFSVQVKSKVEWHQKYTVTPLYQNISQEGVRL